MFGTCVRVSLLADRVLGERPGGAQAGALLAVGVTWARDIIHTHGRPIHMEWMEHSSYRLARPCTLRFALIGGSRAACTRCVLLVPT